MFTNIALIILCLYAVATPFIYMMFIEIGVNLSSSEKKEVFKPKKKRKVKKPEISKEEQKMIDDFKAINDYDGF